MLTDSALRRLIAAKNIAAIGLADLPGHADRKRLREHARVSLREAGRYVGVSDVTILKWERGEFEPSPVHRERYARLLEILAERAA